MEIAIGIASFIIGFFVGGTFFRKVHEKEVERLTSELTSVTTKAADKLTTAYEKIEALTKDNKALTKIINDKNKE